MKWYDSPDGSYRLWTTRPYVTPLADIKLAIETGKKFCSKMVGE